MNRKLTIARIESIVEQSYNYETIRIRAVDLFYRAYKEFGISERCRIIFNPYRHILFSYGKNDIGVEKYFDFELIDIDLPIELAVYYKRCFATCLQILYNQKGLIEI